MQDSLKSINRTRLAEEQDVQNMAEATGDIKRRQQTYMTKADLLQALMENMKRKLDEAKTGLRSAVRPYATLSHLELYTRCQLTGFSHSTDVLGDWIVIS